jgi:hypothetical protein
MCSLSCREKYWEYEYDEVVSPNMYNFDLWVTSGHADHYKVSQCWRQGAAGQMDAAPAAECQEGGQ